jgi:hypothetical protein
MVAFGRVLCTKTSRQCLGARHGDLLGYPECRARSRYPSTQTFFSTVTFPISGLLTAAVPIVHPLRITFSVGVTVLLCRGLLGVFPFDLFTHRVLGIRGNKLGYRRQLPAVLSEVAD